MRLCWSPCNWSPDNCERYAGAWAQTRVLWKSSRYLCNYGVISPAFALVPQRQIRDAAGWGVPQGSVAGRRLSSSSRDQATGRDAEKQRGALASWLWSKAAVRVGQGDVNQVCTGLSALPELVPGSSWFV